MYLAKGTFDFAYQLMLLLLAFLQDTVFAFPVEFVEATLLGNDSQMFMDTCDAQNNELTTSFCQQSAFSLSAFFHGGARGEHACLVTRTDVRIPHDHDCSFMQLHESRRWPRDNTGGNALISQNWIQFQLMKTHATKTS